MAVAVATSMIAQRVQACLGNPVSCQRWSPASGMQNAHWQVLWFSPGHLCRASGGKMRDHDAKTEKIRYSGLDFSLLV
jgi:hypothetical protein